MSQYPSASKKPFGLPREPMLEWSHSRQQRFDTCHRAHYYTECARDGSLPDATPLARNARRLKTLTALPLTIGGALHDRATELVKCVRADEPLPGLHELRRRTSAHLNAVWTSSRDRRKHWMTHPTRVPMLRERYYGPLPTEEQLASLAARVDARLVTLRGLPLWAELAACPPEDVMLVDKFASYILADAGGDDVKVWAAPDIVMRTEPRAPWEVIDVKSGNVATGDALARDIAQVTSYAVYLRHGAQVLSEGEHCRGRLVYLGDGTEMSFDILSCDINMAEYRIRDGALAMYEARCAGEAAAAEAVSAVLADDSATPGAVIAEVAERARRESSGYAMTTDRAKCGRCVFAEVCDPHKPPASGVDPASADGAA